ncbi:hypothetical protein QBK93_31030 [Rhizobium leguminosarum]|uniref:hypothetical protein n=1 Tax=Rhizobium leguminosarum TaxID=384 RepID=UPI0024A8C247|nr:hypothetical protein [Rhizobium leguminosarum]MDI5929080.1 hypothetical protein [Rhizobium leguminosarum]
MTHYLKKRLDEIKEHLGPTLDALDLKVKTETWEDSIVVQFVSRRRDGPMSAVGISFPRKRETRLAEAPWSCAHLLITDWTYRVVGDSGWNLWTMGEDRYYGLPAEPSEMFGRIADAIREHPLVPTLTDTPMCLLNENVANAYEAICPLVDVQIDRHFEHGMVPVEHLTFEDRRGQWVVIDFEHGASHAEVYVWCTLRESVPQRDVARLLEIVRELRDPTPPNPWPYGT